MLGNTNSLDFISHKICLKYLVNRFITWSRSKTATQTDKSPNPKTDFNVVLLFQNLHWSNRIGIVLFVKIRSYKKINDLL